MIRNVEHMLSVLTDLALQLLGWFVIIVVAYKLIRFSFRKYKEHNYFKCVIATGIRYIDQMDGFQFEVFLRMLMNQLGYSAKETKRSNDFGADLVMKGPNRIVIQAKRYGFKNKVGIAAVQEIYAAQRYYQASEAWVMTNSLFTPAARELAKACQVKLFDRNELQHFIEQVQPDQTADDVYHQVEPAPRTCPVCDNHLVAREGPNGNRFMGCKSFPSCKYTEPINTH